LILCIFEFGDAIDVTVKAIFKEITKVDEVNDIAIVVVMLFDVGEAYLI
jgi:hypothetical protein